MDINIVFKKGTTYILLLILLFVPSFLFILLSQKLFFSKISYLFSAIIVALLFLVSLFFYRIKPQTEKMVEQFLFKNRFDYRETLGKFQQGHGFHPRFAVSFKKNLRNDYTDNGG